MLQISLEPQRGNKMAGTKQSFFVGDSKTNRGKGETMINRFLPS